MTEVQIATNAPGKRIGLLVLLIGVYATTVFFSYPPMRRGMLSQGFGGTVLAVATLCAPFLLWPLTRLPRVTNKAKVAWVLCWVMALDHLLIFLCVAGLSTNGHPPVELMASVLLGFAKLALIPATMMLLGWAYIQGEKLVLVATGFLCLIAETVVTSLPV